MTGQEIGVVVVGLAAVTYLVWRWRSRRLAGTCCGAKKCPASERILERLD